GRSAGYLRGRPVRTAGPPHLCAIPRRSRALTVPGGRETSQPHDLCRFSFTATVAPTVGPRSTGCRAPLPRGGRSLRQERRTTASRQPATGHWPGLVISER